MKKSIKILYILMIFSFFQFSKYVNADVKNEITREEFTKSYLGKMDVILDLVNQTEVARDENNNITRKIKENFNSNERNDIKVKIEQIKSVQSKNKDLVSKAKDYVNNRQILRNDLAQAVKNRDKDLVTNLQNQITDINNQIKGIKEEIKINKDNIEPLINDVKKYRQENKTRLESEKSSLENISNIQIKINNEINEKNNLWVGFSNNVNEKNYTDAINDMDNIISTKKDILSDIKSKNTILGSILETQTK